MTVTNKDEDSKSHPTLSLSPSYLFGQDIPHSYLDTLLSLLLDLAGIISEWMMFRCTRKIKPSFYPPRSSPRFRHMWHAFAAPVHCLHQDVLVRYWWLKLEFFVAGFPLPWPRIPTPYLFWMLSKVNPVLTLTFNLNYQRIVEDLCSRWSLFHMESIRTLINLNLHIHWDPYHSPEFMPPPSFSHYYFQLCISSCIYTILFYPNLNFTDRRELLWQKDWLCQSWHVLFLILPLTLFSMFYI